MRRVRGEHGDADKLVFSLHGIPQPYVRQGDPCQRECEQSARAVAERLGLASDRWMLTYQSRDGVRSVQVACPGFSVDCLEILEEIAMQNREGFEEAGGERLEYIPALNDSDPHAALMQAQEEEASAQT